RTVAPVRGAGARDFGLVFDRLHQRDGIEPERRLAAAVLDQTAQGFGRAGLIEPYGFAVELRQIERQVVWRPDIGNLLQRVTHGVVELAVIQVENRATLARDGGEGERQWRM